MIRILFHNLDRAGVNYYRTLVPATELERSHCDEFHVDIDPNIDWNDPKIIDRLSSYNIIHYHRQLHPDVNVMIQLANELKSRGVKLIIDIDDYWELDKSHPVYWLAKENKMSENMVSNIKIADYVTTTTDLFADEIKKITQKDNVMVLPNAVNPEWMKQFENNRTLSSDGLVRITYMAGSSHINDIKQLEGVVNILQANVETKNKFKIIVAGWDDAGSTRDISFNTQLINDLKSCGLWTQQILNLINKSKGNIDLVSQIPEELKNKYRNNVYIINDRPIRSDESVYLQYENILTDNHKLIQSKEYLLWLDMYDKNNYYNEYNFARRWTLPANMYANVLDETDIVIAPLANNKFNQMKSNLKQVECWTRKLPIVCSGIPPYTIDGRNMENCILIPDKKNNYQEWAKALKKLIIDEDLRHRLGEQLYNDFSEKYHLKNVTKNRAIFYKKILES